MQENRINERCPSFRVNGRSLLAHYTTPFVWLLTCSMSILMPLQQAAAHESSPAPLCAQPVRPANDHDDARWNAYLAAVDGFRECISEFAEANRTAAGLHNDAANEAVNQWNIFVKEQLNVPEDFPWPPEGQKRQ